VKQKPVRDEQGPWVGRYEGSGKRKRGRTPRGFTMRRPRKTAKRPGEREGTSQRIKETFEGGGGVGLAARP